MCILKLRVYKKKHDKKITKPVIVRGDYRLSNGMYRTIEEHENHLQKSLKRRLP